MTQQLDTEGKQIDQTQVEKVTEFHKVFNHPLNKFSIGSPAYWEWIKTRIKFLQEEIDELEESIDEADIVKSIDSLIDLRYFDIGTIAGISGLNQKVYDELFAIVHEANMTKLCHDQETLDATVEFYESQGEKVWVDSILLLSGKIAFAVKDYTTGKVKKSVKWEKPEKKLEEKLQHYIHEDLS